jgi:hypothetical protein
MVTATTKATFLKHLTWFVLVVAIGVAIAFLRALPPWLGVEPGSRPAPWIAALMALGNLGVVVGFICDVLILYCLFLLVRDVMRLAADY